MNTDVLSLRFKSRDLRREVTIKEYFITLLKSVWEQKELFNGKRPFGNSDWEYDVYAGLIQHKLIAGKLDARGYATEVNEKAAHDFVLSEIINKL